MFVSIVILLILILLSGFFSASELAFFSLNSAKVSAMVKRKYPRAEMVEKLKKHKRKLLVTVLIGNNLVNIFAASYTTIVVEKIFSSAVLSITTGIMTFLILTFGEIIPKAYATNHPKRVAIFAAPFLVFLEWIFYPIILFFEWLIIALTGKQEIEKISAEEVQALAATSIKQGVFSPQEGMIMHRVFRFNDITAEDVMTPNKQMVFLPDDFTLAQAVEAVKKNKHSRFPVIDKKFNIVGIVHAKDLFLAYAEEGLEGKIIDHMFPIFSVPADLPIDQLLPIFQSKKSHMAIVTDRQDKTIGMVTIEDVIEELVGEIEDEYDRDNDQI